MLYFRHWFLWCYQYEVIVIEYELDSLIIDFNTSSTGMVWVPVELVRSGANRQGNVREFHNVWRVVTLSETYICGTCLPSMFLSRQWAQLTLYCLVTETKKCERFAQGCYAAVYHWQSNPRLLCPESDALVWGIAFSTLADTPTIVNYPQNWYQNVPFHARAWVPYRPSVISESQDS